jgi:hypothetical protein
MRSVRDTTGNRHCYSGPVCRRFAGPPQFSRILVGGEETCCPVQLLFRHGTGESDHVRYPGAHCQTFGGTLSPHSTSPSRRGTYGAATWRSSCPLRGASLHVLCRVAVLRSCGVRGVHAADWHSSRPCRRRSWVRPPRSRTRQMLPACPANDEASCRLWPSGWLRRRFSGAVSNRKGGDFDV